MPDETNPNNLPEQSDETSPPGAEDDVAATEATSEDIDYTSAPVTDDAEMLELDDDELAFDDTKQGREVMLSELNLSHEDATLDVEIILETDLEDETPDTVDEGDDVDDNRELNVSIEAETVPVSILREEELAVDTATDASESQSSNADEDEDEIILHDFLNEDDGETLDDRDYLQPPEPEWKRVARELREEREAKRREMIEKRRAEDQRVIEERQKYEQERRAAREEKQTDFRDVWEKRQQEKKEAVNDMMQRIREQRERKEQERAEREEKEFGRRFTYPEPAARTPYPKPSEVRRMEREQPQNETDLTDTSKPSPPPEQQDDFESRINRLSKPDKPDATPDEKLPEQPADDAGPGDPIADDTDIEVPDNDSDSEPSVD